MVCPGRTWILIGQPLVFVPPRMYPSFGDVTGIGWSLPHLARSLSVGANTARKKRCTIQFEDHLVLICSSLAKTIYFMELLRYFVQISEDTKCFVNKCWGEGILVQNIPIVVFKFFL